MPRKVSQRSAIGFCFKPVLAAAKARVERGSHPFALRQHRGSKSGWLGRWTRNSCDKLHFGWPGITQRPWLTLPLVLGRFDLRKP